jgi:hypothetical protein
VIFNNRGAPEKVSTRNTFDRKEIKDFKRRAKSCQETTINSRLKAFGIIGQAFRTTGTRRLERHKAVMEAGCVKFSLLQ